MNTKKTIHYCLFTVILLTLISCSSGKTTVDTISYYAVPSGDNINYYRVKIKGESKLSQLKYKSGWYPTEALDQLFGNISSDESQNALAVQDKLRNQYNEAIIDVNKSYLNAAKDTSVSNYELNKLMMARKRVLAYPNSSLIVPNSVEIEYNPLQNFAISHSNEKFAIIVSANPNEVVGRIASFSESDKTSSEIKKLSQIFEQQSVNRYYEIQAESTVDQKTDSLIISPLLELLKSSSRSPAKSDKQLLNEVDGLIKLLEEL